MQASKTEETYDNVDDVSRNPKRQFFVDSHSARVRRRGVLMTSRRKERVGGGKTTARPSTQQGAADPPRSPIARGSSGARTPGRPTTAQTMEYMAMTPKTATAALAQSQHHSVSLPDLGATMPATLPRSARAKTPNPSLFTRTGAPLRRDAAAENPWTPPERHTKTSLQDTAYAGRSKLVTLFKNTAIDDPEEFLMSLQKANDGEHKAEARARKEAERLEGCVTFFLFARSPRLLRRKG
jgi:hypothetical protein